MLENFKDLLNIANLGKLIFFRKDGTLCHKILNHIFSYTDNPMNDKRC